MQGSRCAKILEDTQRVTECSLESTVSTWYCEAEDTAGLLFTVLSSAVVLILMRSDHLQMSLTREGLSMSLPMQTRSQQLVLLVMVISKNKGLKLCVVRAVALPGVSHKQCNSSPSWYAPETETARFPGRQLHSHLLPFHPISAKRIHPLKGMKKSKHLYSTLAFTWQERMGEGVRISFSCSV